MNKGKKKYKCVDCGVTRYVHWIELNRAARPRCYACGGSVEPASENAIESLVMANRNLIARGKRKARNSARVT